LPPQVIAENVMPFFVEKIVTLLNATTPEPKMWTFSASSDHTASQAKLSERKTVHEWLNEKGVPREEFGKPICLLRRLAIALEIHATEETPRSPEAKPERP
jgi:hypothetical protein